MDRDPRREALGNILKTLDPEATVYFQPPTNTLLSYPAIVYKRDRMNTQFADNLPYRHSKKYEITVIDGNPDSDIPGKVAQLPSCSHERFFTADNLNHDVFNLFF